MFTFCLSSFAQPVDHTPTQKIQDSFFELLAAEDSYRQSQTQSSNAENAVQLFSARHPINIPQLASLTAKLAAANAATSQAKDAYQSSAVRHLSVIKQFLENVFGYRA
jgi:site-specific recombinase XerD